MVDPQHAPQGNPQTAPPARPSRVPALAGAGLGNVGALTLTLAGAPWGIVLAVALTGLVIVLVQSLVQGTIPQDSPDRLAWWQHYWNYRRTQPQTHTTPPQHPPA
ncbi:hypothetical protein [Streptomyces sp. NBC_01334]|uniref:hypothetical protein n=1 Tax=Streptomyces sp. NBC_01334 TaxID=2903827 RepID=UPI002E1652F6|nr:hypothetical protein OG736_46790 [Streptomyces sp. NBC_01334]